jgi:hypothetical protein
VFGEIDFPFPQFAFFSSLTSLNRSNLPKGDYCQDERREIDGEAQMKNAKITKLND